MIIKELILNINIKKIGPFGPCGNNFKIDDEDFNFLLFHKF